MFKTIYQYGYEKIAQIDEALLLDYIKDNFSPSEVFGDEGKLEDWASDQGYIREGDE